METQYSKQVDGKNDEMATLTWNGRPSICSYKHCHRWQTHLQKKGQPDSNKPYKKFAWNRSITSISSVCLTSSLLEMLSSRRSPANLLGADWSRPKRLCYRTVSQMIVIHCRSQWWTHWALHWLVLLALKLRYHIYVFCCRNRELRQQNETVGFILHHYVDTAVLQ